MCVHGVVKYTDQSLTKAHILCVTGLGSLALVPWFMRIYVLIYTCLGLGSFTCVSRFICMKG